MDKVESHDMRLPKKKLEKAYKSGVKKVDRIYTKTVDSVMLPFTEDNLEYVKKKYNDKFIIVDTEKKVIAIIKKFPKKTWFHGRRYKLHAKFNDKSIEGFPLQGLICQFCKFRVRNATDKCQPGLFTNTGNTEACEFLFIGHEDFFPEKFNAKKDRYIYIKPSYFNSQNTFFTRTHLNNVDFNKVTNNIENITYRSKLGKERKKKKKEITNEHYDLDNVLEEILDECNALETERGE